MPKKILHNNFSQSKEYIDNLEILFSDYSFFRDKIFSQKCLSRLGEMYPSSDLFLTHSATGALEMIALLLEIKEGDEIILPSFTYVSSVTPFVLRGAVPVFVDISPDTLNMDESIVESAITDKTRAILCMHYGGFPADMVKLKQICDRYDLPLIEDAAMGFGCEYNGLPLGSIGDFGAISFDITKHISAIHGGLLLINNPKYVKRASAIYHVGTNRTAFMEREVPYFEWTDVGSKYQMPEMSAAVLEVQLKNQESLLRSRKELAVQYERLLRPLARQGVFRMMDAASAKESVHLFYLLLPSFDERKGLIEHLKANGVEALFHYMPLHASSFGRSRGRFVGNGDHTVDISARLLRLPLHAQMNEEEVEYICRQINQYYIHGA
jgi:dTDP-4-amino-4,6-dideoxygalactose transaminase